jgi:hypothetical protein
VIDGPTILSSKGVRINGISAVGRATVHVLNLNDLRRLELRTEISKHDALD